MTSAICPPRRARGPCSPRTQAMASEMFDLPDPLGPTMTLTPGVNSRVVLSAKDLNPRMVSERRNTGAMLPRPNHTRGISVARSPRDPEPGVSGRRQLLHLRRHHAG